MPPEVQLDLAFGNLAEDEPVDPIVHELIHHDAANSIVNVALQYRWLELLRVVLSTPGQKADEHASAMAADLAATEALLQPLAEGIALFAEFDCCVPDLSPGPSQPLTTATDLISLRLLSLKSTSPSVHEAAISEKLHPTQTRRRADVLANPFYPRRANDAYLLGYLVVKAAWSTYLGSGSATVWPAGAFAEFVHYWVYEDWRLAELLLATPAIGRHTVVRHLADRIRRLLDDDLPVRVDAFQRDKRQREARGMLLRGPEERTHGPLAGLDSTVADVADAHYALARFYLNRVGPGAPVTRGPFAEPETLDEQLHNSLVTPFAEDQEPEAVRAYFERNPGDPKGPLRMLDSLLEMPKLNRSHATLLDLWIEVEIDGHHLTGFRANETGPWRRPRSEIPVNLDRPGLFSARLLAMLTSKASPWRLDCYLVIDRFVRASWSFGEPDAEEFREEVERINFYEVFRATSGIRPEDYLANVINAADTEKGDGALSADPTGEATVTISMAIREALAERDWAGLFALSPAIQDNGVRTLLGGPAVRALAAIGLVNSFTVARAEVTQRLVSQGHDLDALIAACDRTSSEHGVQLLVADVDQLRARV
jgi:hypothetical protein